MAKKILALCVSVLMVMSFFAVVPASAELPDNLVTDYTPGEVTGNLLRDESGNLVTFTASSNGGISTTQRPGEILINQSAAIELSDTAEATRGAVGLAIPKNEAVTAAYNAGGTMLFAAEVCSYNAVEPKVSFGIYQQSYKAIMPKEYPSHNDGLIAGAYGGYKPFVATVVLPEKRNDIQYSLIDFGFANNPAGHMTLGVKNESLYFGTEYAYDIEVTADATEVVAGGSVAVDADIYNQLGNVGTLSQGVTWYALNTDRTEAASGFTFAEGADGKATVSVASSVPTGEYTLVAVADADADLVKGIKVNVENIDLSKDYIPGEIANTNYFSSYSNTYAVSYGNDGTTLTLTTSGAFGDGIAADKQERGVGGAGVAVTGKEFWVAGNTIVFGAKAKAANGEPRVNFAVWQASNPALLTVENPTVADGTPVTSTEYEQVGFTMPIPATGINGSGDIILGFGFAETPSGETEGDRSVKVDIASTYLGIQEAYDIDVTADSTSLFPQKTITVDADVFNQVGLTGTLSQDVTWVAMNADRTEAVDGFTVVEDKDGKAKVTVDFSVATGKYVLVAVADADSKLVKGIEVEVISLASDYEADDAMKDNLITTESFSSNGAIQAGLKADTNQWYGLYSGSGTPTNSSTILGGHIPVGDSSTGLRQVAKTGDHVVFGATVSKNISTDTTVNAVFTASGSTPSLYSKEYGDKGISLPTAYSPYQFGATYELNDATTAGGNWHMRLQFGIVQGTTTEGQNEQFLINPGTMYLGFERAYDMKTSVTGETTIPEGTEATLSVDADVLNQVGSTGYLAQNVTWVAMNDGRTAFVDEITVENGDDGTATVTMAPTVTAGKYKLVAVADNYANIIKSVEITVEAEKPVYDEIKIEKTAGGITVSTDENLTDAQLIFAIYDGGKMTAVNIDTNVTLAAQNAQEYPIPSGFETAKVMLFTKDFKPLTKALN